jgi:translation initiation factor 2 alpha subunit (eIF-2alpha)
MKGNSKSAAKEKRIMKEQEKPVTDMADKAMKNYEQALRTSLKLQEEAVKCFNHMFNQTASPQDWQKRFTNFTALTSEVMPMTQKRMEEVLDLMEKNSRTGAELVKKAVDAAQSPVPAESQAKWMEFWTSSMGAARSNAEALTQISARAIDSWIDFVRRNTEVTEIRVLRGA